MKQLITALLFSSALAGCVDEPMLMETDISEANRNTVCPADVSEADRANYPACN